MKTETIDVRKGYIKKRITGDENEIQSFIKDLNIAQELKYNKLKNIK